MRIVLSFFILITAFSLTAQEDAYKKKYDEQYQKNIKKPVLYGRYIPKDLDDSFVTLDKLMEADMKSFFMSLPDSTAALKTINTVGPWIVHNWSLGEGSRISHYLKTQEDIHHPADMAFFMLQLYHRNLHNAPDRKEELKKYILDRRRKIFEKLVMDKKLGRVEKPDSTSSKP